VKSKYENSTGQACVAVGETEEEVTKRIKEAIEFHLEGLRKDGEPIPVPSRVTLVSV
jgi:predicted RNase H-like HicB family nuclease